MADSIQAYDAGSVDVDSSGVKVLMEMQVHQLLLYPTVDAAVKLNDSTTKEIFLPKGMWTPISISRDFFYTDFVVTLPDDNMQDYFNWFKVIPNS